jgi:hypothetical protein
MTMLEAFSSFTDPTNQISHVDLISSSIFSELVDTFLNLSELATPIFVAESTNQNLPPILLSRLEFVPVFEVVCGLLFF